MALIIETVLQCDICHKQFGLDDRSKTGQTHRKDAANQGWKYCNNTDYCPDCRPKRKDGQYHGTKSQCIAIPTPSNK
jgi:hypothetical protein